MMDVIKNKLQKENQKYYYILILKILDKYKKIKNKEKKEALKNIEKENIKNKEIQKEKDKNLKQNTRYFNNLIITLAPLAYLGYYCLNYFK